MVEATMRATRLSILAASAVTALVFLAALRSATAGPDPIKIAVFDFELADTSASSGVLHKDGADIDNLKEATEVARRMLAASGRYSVVETGSVRTEVKGDIQDCRGCEAGLAGKLGAERSMAGVVTRVGRVEHTVQIVIRDARTGDIVSNDFTGLRMGANYAWPRAVTWLMNNKILSPQRTP
jgi:Protein of unknown function (DUF2380)